MVVSSMLAKEFPIRQRGGRRRQASARGKETSDGQDHENTGGRETHRPLQDYDLAAGPQRRLSDAGEAGESRHRSVGWREGEIERWIEGRPAIDD